MNIIQQQRWSNSVLGKSDRVNGRVSGDHYFMCRKQDWRVTRYDRWSSVRHKENIVQGVRCDNPKIRRANLAMSVNPDKVDSRLSKPIGKERPKP
jgi:hypothetical protein